MECFQHSFLYYVVRIRNRRRDVEIVENDARWPDSCENERQRFQQCIVENLLKKCSKLVIAAL